MFEGITYIALVGVTAMNGLMFEYTSPTGRGWRWVALLGGLASILALNGLLTRTPKLLLGYLVFYVSASLPDPVYSCKSRPYQTLAILATLALLLFTLHTTVRSAARKGEDALGGEEESEFISTSTLTLIDERSLRLLVISLLPNYYALSRVWRSYSCLQQSASKE